MFCWKLRSHRVELVKVYALTYVSEEKRKPAKDCGEFAGFGLEQIAHPNFVECDVKKK